MLLAGQTITSFDVSVLTIAAPSVRRDLHASGAELQLVSSGYLVSFAVLVVVGARLGDRFGSGIDESSRWAWQPSPGCR